MEYGAPCVMTTGTSGTPPWSVSSWASTGWLLHSLPRSSDMVSHTSSFIHLTYIIASGVARVFIMAGHKGSEVFASLYTSQRQGS